MHYDELMSVKMNEALVNKLEHTRVTYWKNKYKYIWNVVNYVVNSFIFVKFQHKIKRTFVRNVASETFYRDNRH